MSSGPRRETTAFAELLNALDDKVSLLARRIGRHSDEVIARHLSCPFARSPFCG